MSCGNPVSSVQTLDLCEQMSRLRTAHGKAEDGSNDDEERDRTLGSRVWFKSTLHLDQVILAVGGQFCFFMRNYVESPRERRR